MIKKEFSHGVRHGKSEEQIYHHQTYNAWKQCRKKKDAQGENYTGILDRFLRSPRYCKSQEELGWDEAECAEMGKLAQEHYTYKLTKSEHLRYSSNWSLQLNSSGSNALMATRPDYRAADALKNYLYRNSEDYQRQIPPQDQDRLREYTKFSETDREGARHLSLLQARGRLINGTGNNFYQVTSPWQQRLDFQFCQMSKHRAARV